MADRFSIGRGNPGTSPVQHEDISGVSLESPVELRSQLKIEIENCSEIGETPCDTLILNIFGVMGQEDQFRHDGGERVQRGGIARVVLSTNVRSDLTIEYKRNPSDEDNPVFDTTLYDVSTGEKHHEFFFGVDPSTLYAFQVDVQASDCPETDKLSGIYYFLTGDEIQLEFENQIKTAPSIEVKPHSSLAETSILGTGQYAGQPDRWYSQDHTSDPTAVTIASTSVVSDTTTENNMSTSYTIT
jgi:hypothetical protein